MKTPFFLIVLFLIVHSCINKTTNSKSTEDETHIIQNEETVKLKTQVSSTDNIEGEAYHNEIYQKAVSDLDFNNTSCIQNFDMFFEKFSTDSIFQKKWILFPLKNSYLGGDFYDDIIIEYIDSSAYIFKDFSADKYAMDKEFSKYSVHIENLDSIVNYSWYGIDNGIMINHVFEKINNCWFLIAIEDEGI